MIRAALCIATTATAVRLQQDETSTNSWSQVTGLSTDDMKAKLMRIDEALATTTEMQDKLREARV